MTAPWSYPLTEAGRAQAQAVAATLPRIETARLVLRAPVIGDFGLWTAIACTERGVNIGGPMSQAEAWDDFCRAVAVWLLRGHGLWSVTTRDGTLQGFVLVGFEPEDSEPELGYLFAAEAEGKGYATEAAAAARAWALGTLGTPSLVSYVSPGHAASAAVALRLGAVRDLASESAFADDPVWVFRHHPQEVAR
jgi:RimJ/RimL family protein N-acetyltransferase